MTAWLVNCKMLFLTDSINDGFSHFYDKQKYLFFIMLYCYKEQYNYSNSRCSRIYIDVMYKRTQTPRIGNVLPSTKVCFLKFQCNRFSTFYTFGTQPMFLNNVEI